MSDFADNVKELRQFLSDLETRRFSQQDMASIIGVSLKQLTRWEKGETDSERSYWTLAEALGRYFAARGLTFTAEDIASPGLVDSLRSRLTHGVKSVHDPKAVSRWALGQLLQDTPLRRILNIDDALLTRLEKLAGEYREGLDKDDWAAVVRMIQEGQEEKDDWKYKDPEARKLEVHFKSPRKLTSRERERVEKIVQEEVEKIAKKERGKEKGK